MKIVFGLSKLQHAPGIPYALERMGYEYAIYPRPMEELQDNEEREQELENFLKKHRVDLMLSNVFINSVARVTNRIGVKYAVWCMDSPTYSTWVPEAEYDNCYLFYFDYREYELRKRSGKHNVYHLPLAADVVWGGAMVISDEEIEKFACNMSFVGGMYTKNLYDKTIEKFTLQQQNDFSDILEKSALVWDGCERLQMNHELVRAVREQCPGIFARVCDMPDEYLARTYFLGRKLTNVERTLLMDLLAERYDIHLYARDDDIVPAGVKRFPPVDAGEEALKVYYSSKINLNITLRSISSGVPARVFDIMSVGGFVLSNWQEEIPELFVENEEIVTYRTPEELVDKADYYLRHSDERVRIGVNGFRKVQERYTYEHRINEIISVVMGKV